MFTRYQDAFPGTENVSPKKMQKFSFETYPALPPTLPDDCYCVTLEEEVDNKDDKPKSTPGWKSDDDSYAFYSPRDKKYFYKEPPTIVKEESMKTSGGINAWDLSQPPHCIENSSPCLLWFQYM